MARHNKLSFNHKDSNVMQRHVKGLKLIFLFLLLFCISFLFFGGIYQAGKQENDLSNNSKSSIIEIAVIDTTRFYDGAFSIPELSIAASPQGASHYNFSKAEKIVDYDVSPAGITTAILVERAGKSVIKFWQIGQSALSDSCSLPDGFVARAITWHPQANALFVMGAAKSNYQIYRIEKRKNGWFSAGIYSTVHRLRRLLVCPRPFITGYNPKNGKEYFAYRIFFGMDNGDKTFRIVSITEQGDRLYQVIGPAKTITNYEDFYAEEYPSTIVASWALPLSFHPAGHQLIWEDQNNNFNVAAYNSRSWGQSNLLKLAIKNSGTITPTPNGLGLVHWQKDKSGIGIFLIANNTEENQLSEYRFISTPSSVPDGRGIVGLTKQNEQYQLSYIPIHVPLPDVLNAWMFADSKEELELFQKYDGLFRPNNGEQLYNLYESENYNCTRYDKSAPTRPYLVTTDIFWELFGAAYQGLFIVKERDAAIPNFLSFIHKAHTYFQNSDKKSKWRSVFTALVDFYNDNSSNPEVLKILKEQDDFSDIHGKRYAYSDLKPRGHYTSSAQMKKYFKAFRYFTTIYKLDQNALKELNAFPSEISTLAENWIHSYSGFIVPSRSPLVWKNVKQAIPSYCLYPRDSLTVFPLSWGFDNEVQFETVFHEGFPEDLTVAGPSGPRLLPSGLDLASCLGNEFAEKLLESDYQKYPPLRKVINNLKNNFKENNHAPDFKNNIYNRWINAIAVQWANTVNSTSGFKDNELWQAKRLQTGLATWATLRHATILVNERTSAECGEGGFEEILMRAPRGYVEPDPNTFAAIADLFDQAIKYVSNTMADKSDFRNSHEPAKRSLYEGIIQRLKEAAQEARIFQAMAEKLKNGVLLDDQENEKVLYVARVAEHLFLVFNSLANEKYGLSNPEPMAKIADVADNGMVPPTCLMVAVGNSIEWNHIVPFYGRRQIVKGSIYSYYEFESEKILNDQEWRDRVPKQELLPWIKPYITNQKAFGMASTRY